MAVIEQQEDKKDKPGINKGPTNNYMAQYKQTGYIPLKPDPLVKREITGIFTRGIVPYDPNSTDYDARWILSIYTESLQYTTD